MAISRPILGLIALIILAGGIVLQFFVILSGVVHTSPVGNTYFLQTTTNDISGSTNNPTRWTFLALCGEENGRNGNCRGAQAALPFDPPRNFGTEANIPEK